MYRRSCRTGEEIPSPDEEAVLVLARSTREDIVVSLPSLPSLRAEVPGLDRLVAELSAPERPDEADQPPATPAAARQTS